MSKSLVFSMLLVGLASACTDSDDDDAGGSSSGTPAPLSVSIPFGVMAGDAEVACGQDVAGVGTTSSTVKVTDARFYVHDVRLLNSSGQEVPVALEQDGTWQKDNVALLDFETGSPGCSEGTAATHKAVTGTVPAGTYNGLVFKLGVPFALNHLDTATAPAPLNLTSMWWNWNGGYKFLKLDMTTTGAAGGWFIHVGSTGCTPEGNAPTTCTNTNTMEVRLTEFEPGHHDVELDLLGLLATSNVDVNAAGAPGCMSGQTDPECAPLFQKLGLAIGSTPAGTQTAFSAVHHHADE